MWYWVVEVVGHVVYVHTSVLRLFFGGWELGLALDGGHMRVARVFFGDWVEGSNRLAFV